MQFEKSSGLNVDHGSHASMQSSTQGVLDAYKALLEKVVATGGVEDRVTGARLIPSKSLLDTVRNQFDGLEKQLIAEHATNQGILNDHTAIVAKCNKDRSDAFAKAGTGVVALMEAMRTARNTHATCRGVEDTNIADMERECGAFKNMDRCGIEDQDWYAKSSMNTITSGQKNSLQSVISQAVQCKADVATVTSKAAECDGNQASFESAYCSYESELQSVCATHSTCYDSAVQHRNTANQSVSQLEEEQQTMWRMVHRVHCYLDLLFAAADEGSAMPTQAGIEKCNAITTATAQGDAEAHIDIRYDAAEAKDACLDNTDLDKENDEYTLASSSYRPGTYSWETAEMNPYSAHGKLTKVGQCE